MSVCVLHVGRHIHMRQLEAFRTVGRALVINSGIVGRAMFYHSNLLAQQALILSSLPLSA